MDAQYATPAQRREVLERLLDIANPQQVKAGFVRMLMQSGSGQRMLDRLHDT